MENSILQVSITRVGQVIHRAVEEIQAIVDDPQLTSSIATHFFQVTMLVPAVGYLWARWSATRFRYD
jgi:hypothetical protein